MSLESQEGIVERLTEKGVFLSGAWFGFSKHLKGPRLTEAHLGHKVTVQFHTYDDRNYIDVVQAIGEKVPGWKPPEKPKGGWGGGGRRFSPEELELKREEGRRIARCCAVERAVDMAKQGVTVREIATDARLLEEYFVTGKLPIEASTPKSVAPTKPAPIPPKSTSPTGPVPSANPPSSPAPAPAKVPAPPPAKPKRLPSKAVSGLFNEALRGGLVDDWQDFLAQIEGVLKVQINNPYQLDAPSFAKIESVIRSKLGQSSAA